MERSSLALLLAALSCGPAQVNSRPQFDALLRQLTSANVELRVEALRTLESRNDAPDSATRAVLEMMVRTGWRGTEVPSACAFLAGTPRRATMAFPLLTDWMLASEGDQVVFLCLERAARTAGAGGLRDALLATASIAKRTLPKVDQDADAMFDTMATARSAYTRPLLELGSGALSVMDRSLGNDDPFVRAEAAGFLALIGDAARPSEPALRRALESERSSWAAHEIRATLAVLRKQ